MENILGQYTLSVSGKLEKVNHGPFDIKKFMRGVMMMPLAIIGGITQANFIDNALGSTETTETNLGTITIPTVGVSRIVGIYGIAYLVTTTAEIASANFRLSFSSVSGTFKFPAMVHGGPAGTLASPGFALPPYIIPVNIPVPPNETVTCFMTLTVAQTGASRGTVGLIME